MHSILPNYLASLMMAAKKCRARHLLILFVLLLGLPFLAYGQDSTIIGTVTDPAGAVIPNVTVTIPHVETGKVRLVTTSDSGQYAATTLDVGHYNVKAEVIGFKVEERQNIVLNVTDRQRVDFQLRLGNSARSSLTSGIIPNSRETLGTVGFPIQSLSWRRSVGNLQHSRQTRTPARSLQLLIPGPSNLA